MYDKGRIALIKKVLSEPELFPDEFKSWPARQISTDPNFALDRTQLPTVDKPHDVAGGVGFQNGWVNNGGGAEVARYYKDPWGIVHIEGVLTNGAPVVGANIFTLPAGWRPAQQRIFGCISGNPAIARIDVNANGNVIWWGGGGIFWSLDG